MSYKVLPVECGWSVFWLETPDAEPRLIPHTNEVGETVPYTHRQAAYRRKKSLEGARAMAQVNVWIKEAIDEKEEYCLVENAQRITAIRGLRETILDNGKVPAWVESVKFYERGDFPTETYKTGDTVK